jgi:hypothetical protein
MTSREAHVFLQKMLSMDGDPFEGTFSNLHTADDTKVQYLDSRDGVWEAVDGQLAFEKKISSLVYKYPFLISLYYM